MIIGEDKRYMIPLFRQFQQREPKFIGWWSELGNEFVSSTEEGLNKLIEYIIEIYPPKYTVIVYAMKIRDGSYRTFTHNYIENDISKPFNIGKDKILYKRYPKI